MPTPVTDELAAAWKADFLAGKTCKEIGVAHGHPPSVVRFRLVLDGVIASTESGHTAETMRTWIDMYRNGGSTDGIAANHHTGTSNATVRSVMLAAGVPLRRVGSKGMTDEARAAFETEICEKWFSGMSVRMIAHDYRPTLNESTVQGILVRRGARKRQYKYYKPEHLFK